MTSKLLRRRGSPTVWFTADAIATWRAAPRTTPEGLPPYSDLAITTALTLRTVFLAQAALKHSGCSEPSRMPA